MFPVSKVLQRGHHWSPVFASCKRKINESPVQSGLSMTPSDIERLAKQGIAVSTPNASQFFNDDSGESWNVDPIYLRDSDRNTMWETSQLAKAKIATANRRDKQKYGK